MSLSQHLKGWRTVIASRIVTLCGLAVAAHDYLLPYVTSVDLTPITQRLPSWAIPLIIIGVGIVFDILRHETNTEVGKKE